MNRTEFRKMFKSAGPAILPVVHVRDAAQALRNVKVALGEAAHGVFLINHDFPRDDLMPIIEEVRQQLPELWLGVNFLGVTGRDAFPILGQLAARNVEVDAYWADDACIDEHQSQQAEAEAIDAARKASGWTGLYLGGTAFKKQREVAPDDCARAAEIASRHMDAVTTSGMATGMTAEVSKIEAFRRGCGDNALALASGVTPDNVHLYGGLVDAILVATGINRAGDFYNIDAERLRALILRARHTALSKASKGPSRTDSDRHERWYLPRMAPNMKGEKFAWLDPSSVYVNACSFHALIDDLAAPFDPSEFDVVAGPDAMGFVLGTALATKFRKGFLTIRKAGRISVDTDQVEFTNYTGRVQALEMRKPAFARGTRVLLVDQWIETGGTMEGAIRLVERQGGVVAGIATVCIEESEATAKLRATYKCSTAVLLGTEIQAQCNEKWLDSFKDFDPAVNFPELE